MAAVKIGKMIKNGARIRFRNTRILDNGCCYRIWGIFRAHRMLYDRYRVSTSTDVLHSVRVYVGVKHRKKDMGDM